MRMSRLAGWAAIPGSGPFGEKGVILTVKFRLHTHKHSIEKCLILITTHTHTRWSAFQKRVTLTQPAKIRESCPYTNLNSNTHPFFCFFINHQPCNLVLFVTSSLSVLRYIVTLLCLRSAARVSSSLSSYSLQIPQDEEKMGKNATITLYRINPKIAFYHSSWYMG